MKVCMSQGGEEARLKVGSGFREEEKGCRVLDC